MPPLSARHLCTTFSQLTCEFSTSIVGLGAGRAMNRWLLEEAAEAARPLATCALHGQEEHRRIDPQAGHGEFLALSSPSSIDKAGPSTISTSKVVETVT